MPNSLSPEAEKILAVGYAESDNPYRLNLRSKLTVLTYLRICEEISQQLPTTTKGATTRLLDWGMGAGQMSYLLSKRGYNVIGYNYIEGEAAEKIKLGESAQAETNSNGKAVWNSTSQFADLELPAVNTTDPVTLPFPDNSFDAVLSCGVLEHVSDDVGSLREIQRILKPGGILFIYQLPQKDSWLEFFIGRFKLGYVHERKYSASSIKQLLAAEGFGVSRLRRANMLPKNFTGLPSRFKQMFEKQPTVVLTVDDALSRVPGLNRVSGILELTAYKL